MRRHRIKEVGGEFKSSWLEYYLLFCRSLEMCCGLPFKSIRVECVRARTNADSIVIQEIFNSMKERFALIDVKKNHKSLNKKQIADINITNEIKIITASDKVHNLWNEVISSQTQGLLINLETLTMWKDSKGWNQERDGVIT